MGPCRLVGVGWGWVPASDASSGNVLTLPASLTCEPTHATTHQHLQAKSALDIMRSLLVFQVGMLGETWMDYHSLVVATISILMFYCLSVQPALDPWHPLLQACKIRPLVTHADSVLAWSKRVFGPTLTNLVIKHTFYRQFVAGECLEDCARTLAALRALGVGGITYNAESEWRPHKGRSPLLC